MITRHRPAELDSVDVEILRMLSQGAQGESIATHLGLTVRTLQRRIAGIKVRLGARSTIAAVVCAIRRGLI